MAIDSKNIPIPELLDLAGNTALVTGASGLLGRQVALRLAEAGAAIVAHTRGGPERLDDLRQRIEADGGTCRCVCANLESDSDIRQLFDELDREGECVDILVNNAALQPVTDFRRLKMADWDAVLRVNLDAAFLLTKLAGERMVCAGGGAVINIASIEGSDPAPGHAHYATAKAGLLMLTRSTAAELGRSGVRVNAVSPGLIGRDRLDTDWPDGVRRWRDKAPLGRLGRASDVADAVLFLASPAARWISGENLVVDGGMSAVSRW